MLPDRVSNPGPLTYESGALPIALRGSAISKREFMQVSMHLFLEKRQKAMSLPQPHHRFY